MGNLLPLKHVGGRPVDTSAGAMADTGPPVALTSFIGREADIAAVVAQLDDEATRLLTLIGPGGVGKTRLAAEVMRRVGGDFADGARFVRLAALRDPALAPAALAQALGVQRRGDRPLLEQITQVLAGQHLLLVLDNFEQLLDDAPVFLAGLLHACPRLKILVTSRTALNISGEHRYAVPPLPVPGPDAAESAAVDLFVDRARSVRPGLALGPAAVAAIGDICRRLEGLPLAIELAAARVTIFSPEQLVRRLDDRFDLLQGAHRDVPERQRSLRNAFAWSYDLLRPDEQRLFRQLSVFVGGFTLDAAAAVAAPPDAGIVDGIASLADRSLLRLADDAADVPRYTMLETLREYGRELLAASGEEQVVRGRHARWYLALASMATPLDPSGQEAWLRGLEPEYANVHAALAHLAGEGRMVDLAALATGLRWFWFLTGREAEGLDWYERALAWSGVLPDPLRTDTLLFAGHFSDKLGIAGGTDHIGEALHRARLSGDARREAEAIFYVALAAENRGDYATAEARFRDAAALYEQVGNAWRASGIDYHLGVLAYAAGDRERAARLLERARTGPRGGDPMVLALCDSFLALIACERGDKRHAAELIHSALPDADAEVRADDRIVLGAAAVVAVEMGHPVMAARLLGLSARSNAQLTLPERPAFERAEATAREQLGDAAYERAFESGRRLRLGRARDEIAHLLAPATPPAADSQVPLPELTPREIEVLRLLASGLANQQIADALFISRKTVAHHVASILAKLDVETRTAAVGVAIRNGLV